MLSWGVLSGMMIWTGQPFVDIFEP
jgi:hypothetical protein